MAKHYVICENMCLQEAYSKDEIDKLNERLYFKISFSDCNGKDGGAAFVGKADFPEYMKTINEYYIESIMIQDKNSNSYGKQTSIGATLKTVNGNDVKIADVNVKYRELNGGHGAICNYNFDLNVPDDDTVSFDVHIFLRKIHEEPKLLDK